MTESPAPALDAGPATPAGVMTWLGNTAAAPPDQLVTVVQAVNVWVRRLTGTTAATQWDADVVLGALMLAGRLWRRRDSPAGVETFAGDGAVYVQRNDPDVALLLGLGPYAAPRVG